MIKTIKVKKQLRLDELIKYVIDKGLDSFQFTSDSNVDVYFSSNGHFLIPGDCNGKGRSIELSDTFTVEVEEEITEDTKIPKTATITENGTINSSWNNSINGLKSYYPDAVQIHAIINGKLELIWERESDEI